jgi:Protein kinase domain
VPNYGSDQHGLMTIGVNGEITALSSSLSATFGGADDEICKKNGKRKSKASKKGKKSRRKCEPGGSGLVKLDSFDWDLKTIRSAVVEQSKAPDEVTNFQSMFRRVAVDRDVFYDSIPPEEEEEDDDDDEEEEEEEEEDDDDDEAEEEEQLEWPDGLVQASQLPAIEPPSATLFEESVPQTMQALNNAVGKYGDSVKQLEACASDAMNRAPRRSSGGLADFGEGNDGDDVDSDATVSCDDESIADDDVDIAKFVAPVPSPRHVTLAAVSAEQSDNVEACERAIGALMVAVSSGHLDADADAAAASSSSDANLSSKASSSSSGAVDGKTKKKSNKKKKEGDDVSSSSSSSSSPKEHEYYLLRVISERSRTGLEPCKEYPIESGAMIANRYKIEEMIGSAAFSRAVSALDTWRDDKRVCIKIIENNKEFIDQSLDEIKILMYLNRCGDADEKRVLRLFDYFYYKEHLFIVCELLRENLYEFYHYNLRSSDPVYFILPRVRRVAVQVLRALEYTHSLSLIHADLKPESMLPRARE